MIILCLMFDVLTWKLTPSAHSRVSSRSPACLSLWRPASMASLWSPQSTTSLVTTGDIMSSWLEVDESQP